MSEVREAFSSRDRRGRLWRVGAAVMGLGLLALSAAAQPEPSYLVEREIEAGGQYRRVSVFRSGQAVLVRRIEGREPDIRRVGLSGEELRALSQLLEECYASLTQERLPSARVGQVYAHYRLAPPGREPLALSIPLAGVGTPASVRLGAAVDGLEGRLATERLDIEDLSAWEPAVGERLELQDGSRVVVRRVFRRGETVVVHVDVLGAPTSVFWELDELRRLAVRRVPTP